MKHKQFIDLANTNFNLPEMVNELSSTCCFHNKKFISVKDFGTVFVGWDKLQTDTQKESALDFSTAPESPLFIVPDEWRMPHLLRALGAFKSASQAAKNGWNKDIEPGITEIVIRINKVRGSVWIHKVSDVDLLD